MHFTSVYILVTLLAATVEAAPLDLTESELSAMHRRDSTNLGTQLQHFNLPDFEDQQHSVVKRATSPYSRQTKKDIFMSRGWGAGGMPFSVLYLNQRNRGNHIEKMTARPTPNTFYNVPIVHHPRRSSYNTIPQLFVSYGWGPMG